MAKWETVLLALAGIVVTLGLGLIGVGFSAQSTAGDNPDPWFIAGAWLIGAALFALLFFFALWPLLKLLPRLRRRIEGTNRGAVALPASGLRIHAAVYGVGLDVADVVNGRISGGSLIIDAVENDIAPEDPVPDKLKTLFVTYSRDGSIGTVAVEEHQPLTLR